MKKFFHRFSAAPEKGQSDGHFIKRKDDETFREKVRLDEGKERMGSGDRVKALAARYETMSGRSDVKQHHSSADPPLPSAPTRTSSNNSRGYKSVGLRSARERSPLLNVDKPLPVMVDQAKTPAARTSSPPPSQPSPPTMTARLQGRDGEEANDSLAQFSSSPTRRSNSEVGTLQLPSNVARHPKDTRDASGASGSSSGSGGHQATHKSVAFAPSPKKPVRPSSPVIHSSNQEGGNGDLSLATSSSSSANVGNFARATLASTARARSSVSRQQQPTPEQPGPSSSSTFLPQTSPTAMGPPPSRPNSSLGNARPQPRRSNSSSTPGRRSVNGWSGSGTENGMPTISQPNISSPIPVSGNAGSSGHGMASTLSLTHGAGDAFSHLPNSIPFVSTLGGAHLRSASPQSLATNSSMPASQYPLNSTSSRRGSWTGRANSSGSINQGWASSGAKSVGGPSWSEMTQEDLVCNLGARERTRQEVLWEIVASEERYVKELERTKELYLDALLHPLRFNPGTGSPAGTTDSASSKPRNSLSLETSGDLPIAARFMGAEYGAIDAVTHSRMPDEAVKQANDSRPTTQNGVETVSPSVSHAGTLGANTRELRASTKTANPRRWSNSRLSGQASGLGSTQTGYGISEGVGLSVPLPTSLRITLEAISNGMLEAHSLLSEALKQRYEEQWPLVRSLADVFSRFAHLLDHYKDYVIHLERSLDCLEEAALMERAMRGKRLKKDKLTMTVGLGRAVASLESAAMEKGECSLAIFLAMPFQRLLKYPLLFQNLLFHTDASTYEFESTVKMVVDVEAIVRSIEDEKANKEERDKTIDAFARIEGIKDRSLLRPKGDRLVVEERALYEENPRRAISESNDGGEGGSQGKGATSLLIPPSTSSPGTLRAALKSKRSYRRLSDFLTTDDQSTKAPNMGSKRDIWLVRFSDVELKCQRVGVTALPMVSSIALQQPTSQQQRGETEEGTGVVMNEDEEQIRAEFKRTKESKERMKALRNTTLRSKTRNLYKFLAVTSWKQVQRDRGAEEEAHLEGLSTPQEVDEEDEGDEDGEEGEEDDKSSTTSQETDAGVLDSERYVRQSKLSFSYWGHDKVEPKPLPVRSSNLVSPHSSSVSAFRSRETALSLPSAKRHPPTPPGSGHGPAPAATAAPQPSSSRVVASNSHAKTKVDKFGNRLRQTGEGNGLTNVHRHSTSRLPSSSKPSLLTADERLPSHDLQATQARTAGSKFTTNTVQNRPSFMRDQSVDSNLKLLGSLIDGGDSNSRL